SAAKAFFAEVSGEVSPALQRLSAALDQAAMVTRQISASLRTAEQEAANLFKSGDAPAAASSSDSGGGVLGGVSDFFKGAWDEGSDMVSGLWHMVRHPIDTAV